MLKLFYKSLIYAKNNNTVKPRDTILIRSMTIVVCPKKLFHIIYFYFN